MKSILEQIYFKLPLVLQNLAVSLFGIHWYNRRYGGVFKKELLECRKREFYNQEQWVLYQEEQLRFLLMHAYDTVPYYKKLFIENGITKTELKTFTIDHITSIPFLNKDTFRKLGTTAMLSSKLEPHGEYLASSGSTGTPTMIRMSKRMQQTYYAFVESRMNNWAGVNYKIPRGTIGGRRIIREGSSKGPYYRYNFVEKQTYYSAYHISAKSAPNYLEGMVKNNVRYMTGYASSNYFLARFIEEAGLKAPQLDAVLTSSEKLTKEMRDTFYRVYGCKTYDSYNGVEATCLISDCEYGKLHISPDVGIVEILNSNNENCLPGETGEIVTTGLLNFDQPMIRYRMGDFITLSKGQSCKCGRTMPIVEEIVGRIEDMVIGKDGREMVRFHSIFVNIPSIIEGQIIQHTLTNFEIKLVVSKRLNQDELQLIKGRMKSQLGEVDIVVNIVDSILKGSNGKFKAVISGLTRTA